jgi:hypothetical protein
MRRAAPPRLRPPPHGGCGGADNRPTMSSFARSGSGRRPFPPQNARNALGRAALLGSHCPERPRSSRPAPPPSMSASRAACRPQNRRAEDLRTPRSLASRRAETLGARRPALFSEPPTGRSTRTLLDVSPGVASVVASPPFGVARNGLARAAPVRGVARNGLARAAPVRGAARNGLGRRTLTRSIARNGLGRVAPVRGAARNGSGRAAPSSSALPERPGTPRPNLFGAFLRPRAPLPVS